MSSIFGNLGLKQYVNWQISATEHFDAEDLSLIKYNEVVKSTWGISVHIVLINGAGLYLPIDKNCHRYDIGDHADLSKAFVKVLVKPDGDKCFKIDFD